MGYAPPELFSGRVEPRSDVYGLGATIFHLLTGADPQDNPLLILDFAKTRGRGRLRLRSRRDGTNSDAGGGVQPKIDFVPPVKCAMSSPNILRN
jgi:hypothetical protein